MKYLTCISQGFGKCTKDTLQNNYFWGTPLGDCFCLQIWSRYHYNKKCRKFKSILIWRNSRKMNRNKNLILYLGKKLSEAVARRCFVKMVFLEISQNLQENNCARVSFLIKLHPEACNFIKKETLAQVFSCEFCVISNNTFFIEHLRWLLLKFSMLFLFNFLPRSSL